MADNAALQEAIKRGLVPAPSGAAESPALAEAKRRGLIEADAGAQSPPVESAKPETTLPGISASAAANRSGHMTDADRVKTEGLEQGVKDIGMGAAQLAAHAFGGGIASQYMDRSVADQNAAYEKYRAEHGADPNSFDWSRATGNLLPTVPLAFVAAPETILGGMAAGALTGGTSAAMQPVTDTSQGDYWTQKGTQTAVGAGTGGLVQGGGNALAKVVAPKVAPYVQKLMSKGVTPTPGQIMGGMANKIEERLSSVPIVGDMMAAGRRRAQEEFNTAVGNEVLAPIGQKTTAAPGRELIADVDRKVGAEYDRILPNITFKQDMQLATEVGNLRSTVASKLPDKEAKVFESEIADIQKKLQHGGQMSGPDFKAVESHLGALAGQFKRAQDAYQNQLGDYLFDLQMAMRDSLPRTNPAFSDPLKNVNAAWAKFKRLQRASTYVGTQATEPGIFTGDQFQSAVKAMDTSKDKGAFARGGAQMQDLSDAAKSVLGSRVPNSGTPERLAAMLMGGGGLAYLEPTTLAATAAMTLPYTRVGQKALATALARRPAGAGAVADKIRQLTPAARQALVGALLGPGGVVAGGSSNAP